LTIAFWKSTISWKPALTWKEDANPTSFIVI
jgi:hypothetical protein